MFDSVYQTLKKESFKNIISQCVFQNEVNDNQYGEGELIRHKLYKTPLFLYTKTFHEKQDAIKFQEKASLRLMISDPTIARLIAINYKEIKSFCGSHYRVQMIYEYSHHTLQDFIVDAKRPFSEKELLEIIDQISQSLIVFSQFNILHGYIQPSNILLFRNDQRQIIYKLLDVRFLKDSFEYKDYLLGFSTKCYLSPQLIKAYKCRTMNPVYNYEKSEIFSLGLCIMECCNLRYPEIYSMDSINQQKLEQCLEQVRDKYGQDLYSIVRKMVEIEEKRRFSLQELQMEVKALLELKYRRPKNESSLGLKELVNGSDITQRKTGVSVSPISHQKQHQLESLEYEYSNKNQSKESVVHWERQPRQFEQYKRSNKDYQTRPCPSPINRIKEYKQKLIIDSSTITQRSVDNFVASYEFVDAIKLDAPQTLQSEFEKLQYKLEQPSSSLFSI